MRKDLKTALVVLGVFVFLTVVGYTVFALIRLTTDVRPILWMIVIVPAVCVFLHLLRRAYAELYTVRKSIPACVIGLMASQNHCLVKIEVSSVAHWGTVEDDNVGLMTVPLVGDIGEELFAELEEGSWIMIDQTKRTFSDGRVVTGYDFDSIRLRDS